MRSQIPSFVHSCSGNSSAWNGKYASFAPGAVTVGIPVYVYLYIHVSVGVKSVKNTNRENLNANVCKLSSAFNYTHFVPARRVSI